jgi:ferric-dicitrate binding protein FerR (iron transport regulator)
LKEKVITQLLSNEQFISWVKEPNKKLEVFWRQWKEAHPDRHKELEYARFVIGQTRFRNANVNKQAFDNILTRVLAHDNKNPAKHITNKRRFVLWYQVAASITLFIALGGIFLFQSTHHSFTAQKLEILNKITKSTLYGQKQSFSLPDRTQVNLNAGSSLTFDESYANSRTREADLRGEAFFNVRKDPLKPFRVHAGACTVTALGTSFSIRAFHDEQTTTVSLTEGQVMIEFTGVDLKNNDRKSFYLQPNEMLEFDKTTGICRILHFTPDDEISWIKGVLTFNKSNLYEVVKTIERWYGVNFMISGLPDESWTLTWKFNNQSLELVMQSIAYSEGIDYKLEYEKLIILF